MWIKQVDYVALIDKNARAETRADWFMARINQLELELGTLKHEMTGRPVAIPTLRKEATPMVDNPAETQFEDVGDELAKKFGVDWDQRNT